MMAIRRGSGTPPPKERFFKVAFPERAGALRRFLDKISDRFVVLARWLKGSSSCFSCC